jgi:hypothetical protein
MFLRETVMKLSLDDPKTGVLFIVLILICLFALEIYGCNPAVNTPPQDAGQDETKTKEIAELGFHVPPDHS